MKYSFLLPLYSKESVPLQSVTLIQNFMRNTYPQDSFEIIICVNPVSEASDPELLRVKAAFETEPKVQVIGLENKAGKGAALKFAFEKSKGEVIILSDADLPFGVDFLRQGLTETADFITANRKLDQSFVEFSIRALPFAYRRQRLGQFFNSFSRALLRVPSRDTQAGGKILSRQFALQAFKAQTCDNFFFDLEHFMVQRRQRFIHKEIAVTFTIHDPTSTIRFKTEFFRALFWLAKIRLNGLQGVYDV